MSNGFLVAASADIPAAREIAGGFGLDVIDASAGGDGPALLAQLQAAANVGVMLSTASARDEVFASLLEVLAERLPNAQLIAIDPGARAAFAFLPPAWPEMPFEQARQYSERRREIEAAQSGAEAPQSQPEPEPEPEPEPPPAEDSELLGGEETAPPPAPMKEPAQEQAEPESDLTARDAEQQEPEEERPAPAPPDAPQQAEDNPEPVENEAPAPESAQAEAPASEAPAPDSPWSDEPEAPLSEESGEALLGADETEQARADDAIGGAMWESEDNAVSEDADELPAPDGFAAPGETPSDDAEAFGLEPPSGPVTPAPEPEPQAPEPPSAAAPAPARERAATEEFTPPVARTRSPSQTAPADATAFAPKKLRRGTPELLRVVVHQPRDLKEVIKTAKLIDPRTHAAPQAMRIGDIALGANIGVTLEARGAICDGSLQRRRWSGEPIDFNFTVDADSGTRQVVFLARIFVDDAQIGTIAFTRSVTGAEKPPAQVGANERMKRHKRVFLSYSSADRETVAAIATAYEAAGVPHFWDRTGLEPGEMWPAKLRREINKADLFHLCWSRNAAKSEWVEKEAEHALSRHRRSKGKKPQITVQMLDGPPWAPHPAHLNAINFDDFVRAAIVGYARGDGAEDGPSGGGET